MTALPLDHIALIGYSILFVFSALQLTRTAAAPVDLIANLMLLIGLGSLISYHYTRIRTGLDETNDVSQRTTRQAAHASIVAFFLLTLLPASTSAFQPYDVFALFSHAYLLYAVTAGAGQLLGAAGLFVYFVMASCRSSTKNGQEIIQLLGRILLTLYFGVGTYTGVAAII